MKKFISAALVVAMTAASCANKEELGNNNPGTPAQPQGDGSVTFVADFAEPISKTTPSYDANAHAVAVLWEQNDKVGVYAGENGPAEFTAQAAGATTTLKGSIGAADTYYAMYPYDANASIAAGQISTALPAEQTATADAFMAHLAVASTTGSTLNFKNVCGLVRVYVGCEHVTKIEFKGNAEEIVAGEIIVNATTASYANGAATEKVITVTPPADAATFPVGAYYFSVLPQNFTKGFTVTYYTANGNVDTRSTDAVNVQRSNLVVGRALTAIAGEGSDAKPFIVANVHDLCCLSEVLLEDSANYVELANDIDMSGVETWTPINNDRRAENVREIHFDGKNYIISNFAPTTFIDGLALEKGELVSKTNYSLFGILYGSCKNLTIENAVIDQASSSTTAIVAAFGGYAGIDETSQTVFENVHVTGSVNATKVVSGFAAQSHNSLYKNCSAEVTVVGADNHVGGMVARCNGAGANNFESCYVKGSVTCSKTKGRFIGGIYGGDDAYTGQSMSFTNCCADVTIKAAYQASPFVGYFDAGTYTITNCFAIGSNTPYSTSKQYGGIVGASKGNLTITNTYFAGSLKSNKDESVGGIVGLCAGGATVVKNSFSIATLECPTYGVGGVVGYINDKATSLTIEDCYTSGTYTAASGAGAMVGKADVATTIKNCIHYANVDAIVGAGTVTEENNSKLAAAYTNASAVATALGWDTDVWNLTGETPTLKCFE